MSLIVETYEDIGITRLSRWIFNCYVVHNRGGTPVVIDPGLPGLVDDVRPVMTRLGLAPDAPLSICATHAHSDHVGGAPALADATGTPVHLPEPARPYLAGTTPRSPGPSAIAKIWPTVFDQPFDAAGVAGGVRGARIAGYGTSGGMRWPAHVPVSFLVDGDTLPGASDWEVIAAPGHTDDSTAFWHAGTGTLLSGDAVLSVEGRAWVTPETVDDASSAATAERLRKLDVAHLLPGHGRPVHGERLMSAALAPDEGPKGLVSFSVSLLRCLRGR